MALRDIWFHERMFSAKNWHWKFDLRLLTIFEIFAWGKIFTIGLFLLQEHILQCLLLLIFRFLLQEHLVHFLPMPGISQVLLFVLLIVEAILSNRLLFRVLKRLVHLMVMQNSSGNQSWTPVSGFFVQARDDATGKILGSFLPSAYRLMNCFDVANSSVSHSDNKRKNE